MCVNMPLNGRSVRRVRDDGEMCLIGLIECFAFTSIMNILIP